MTTKDVSPSDVAMCIDYACDGLIADGRREDSQTLLAAIQALLQATLQGTEFILYLDYGDGVVPKSEAFSNRAIVGLNTVLPLDGGLVHVTDDPET